MEDILQFPSCGQKREVSWSGLAQVLRCYLQAPEHAVTPLWTSPGRNQTNCHCWMSLSSLLASRMLLESPISNRNKLCVNAVNKCHNVKTFLLFLFLHITAMNTRATPTTARMAKSKATTTHHTWNEGTGTVGGGVTGGKDEGKRRERKKRGERERAG